MSSENGGHFASDHLSSYHINAAEIKLVQYNIFMKIKPTTSIMKTHIKHARIIGLVYKSISASSQWISNYDENCIESAIPDMNGNCRDQSRYEPSQLETSSQCNNVSHWLGAYLDWSLELNTKPEALSISPSCLWGVNCEYLGEH